MIWRVFRRIVCLSVENNAYLCKIVTNENEVKTMNFEREKIEEFAGLIERAENIVLLGHFNPDGDAIGSTLGLYHYLESMGKKSCIIYPNECPIAPLVYLEGIDYMIYTNGEKAARYRIKHADLVICADFATLSRTSPPIQECIAGLDCPKITIDHHENPDPTDLLFSDIEASSTCELVYKILSACNEKHITLSCATALYMGICTDTGSFSHSCSRRDVFDVAAALVEKGVDVAAIKRQVVDLSTENRLRLLGYVLKDKLKVFPEKGAAYMAVSRKELKQYGFQKGDLEGVVNYALRIEGIRFAALISERQDKIRMSFRSLSPTVDVNKYASRYWNGGGHIMAAGGYSLLGLDLTCQMLEQHIEKRRYEKC